jgi:hypothetical protein
MAALSRPVGGFFERHTPGAPVDGPGVLEVWTGGRPYAAFINARSAFAALVAQLAPPTVWLPAWLCRDLVQPTWADRVRFYGVGEGFHPDLSGVETDARPGDLLLVLAAFGLPVAAPTRAFIVSRPDLHVVEDRAQALDPVIDAGAGWVLYSPRKLLGVADGGLLVAGHTDAALPRPDTAPDAGALWRAPDLRAADPPGFDTALWHAANQQKEGTMTVSTEAMTPDSLAILSTTPLASLTAPRLRNWRTLDQRLAPWSVLPADPGAAPLGYVLDLEPETRDRLRGRLNAARIFAAVHWPELASPPAAFPREHGWTRRLLTLPCDHRYDEAEMTAVADLVVEALR